MFPALRSGILPAAVFCLIAAILPALFLAGCGPSAEEAEARTEHKLREAAAEWEGAPYKEGGTDKEGVDCSGFVQAVYREVFDRELPRSTKLQEKVSVEVEPDSIRLGDLVFFRTKGFGPFFKKHHVGVYIGKQEFVHASSSKGVMISRLDDYYWKKNFDKVVRPKSEEKR